MPLLDRPAVWYADHRDPTVHRLPVVMLHGAGGSHLDWPAELRRLPEANAIALDLPGHGRSPGPGRSTVSAYAADVVAVLDALKLPQAIIMGYSLGGGIAQVVAAQYKKRVAGLILLATSARLTVNPTLLDGLQNDYDATLQKLIDWQWADPAGEQIKRLSLRRLQEMDRAVLRSDYQAANQFDGRDRLAQIEAPTLIIGGTADRMTPVAESDYLHEHITGSKLVKITGGGHLMALEQPLVVASAVQEWLLEQYP